MKSFIFSVFGLLAVCCVSFFAVTPVAAAEESTGDFPPSVSFQEAGQAYNLQLTGIALRKKFIIKVYNIGSYVQDASTLQGSDKLEAIMTSDKAKQLTFKWLRDVPVDKVQEGYHQGFKKTLSDAQQAQLKTQIDTYIGFFSSSVQKGDEHILRWLPGGVIDVIVNGKAVGTITSNEFAQGLWLIWFGPDSILVDREALVSQLK